MLGTVDGTKAHRIHRSIAYDYALLGYFFVHNSASQGREDNKGRKLAQEWK